MLPAKPLAYFKKQDFQDIRVTLPKVIKALPHPRSAVLTQYTLPAVPCRECMHGLSDSPSQDGSDVGDEPFGGVEAQDAHTMPTLQTQLPMTCSHGHSHTVTVAVTQSRSHSHNQCHSHTGTVALTQSRSLSLSHSHCHSHTVIVTQSPSLSHSHCHSHTLTCAQPLSRDHSHMVMVSLMWSSPSIPITDNNPVLEI